MRKSLVAMLFSLVVAFVIAGTSPVRALPQSGADDAASRRELRDLQQFLHDHPWIANKLRQKPSLANDPGFLNGNPELPQFLNAHPFIQGSFRVNAEALMQKEQAFESSPAREGDKHEDPRHEMRDFQHFITGHPWIADKLNQNPALANDQGFLRGNHELPDFLNGHPFVQQQFRTDPKGFMQRANEFANREAKWRSHGSDLADLNQFMANHPWIGKKIQEDPTLASNGSFLDDNRELKAFLGAHAYLRQQFKEDPQGLMDRAHEFAVQGSM